MLNSVIPDGAEKALGKPSTGLPPEHAPPLSKFCGGCKNTLPIDRFYVHTNKSGFSSRCIQCVREQAKLWRIKNSERVKFLMDRWRIANPDYHKNYIKLHPTKRRPTIKTHHVNGKRVSVEEWIAWKEHQIKDREARRESERLKKLTPPGCKIHFQHNKWSKGRNGTWYCLLCSEENHKASNLRAILRRIESEFGEPFFTEYKNLCDDPSFIKMGGKKRIFEVKKAVFFRDFGHKLTLESVFRIGRLNIISKKHCLNFGWSCSSCFTEDKNPWFFDIDHVIPKSKGGSDKADNLQVLCPNCHRKKTISDLSLGANTSSRVAAADSFCASEGQALRGICREGPKPLRSLI